MKWIGTQTIYDHVRLVKGITLDRISITTVQSSGESFVDNDTSLMTSAAIDDRINTAVTAEDLDLTADSGTAAVDLNSQALAVTGGTGITTSATGQAVTLNVDVSIPEITTLAGLTSFGAAGATTDIVAGDLTMYNAVNDGNPTISLGSSATNRLEIKSTYNSGTQALCDIDFTTYTSSGTGNDGRFNWFVDEVLLALLNDNSLLVYGNISSIDANATITANDSTTSSATQGGKLKLISDDSAAMGDDHRLGVIEFQGAEDGSNTRSIGARIQAVCRDAWDGSNNDADLEFYTTDGTTESKVLTLDADKLATFAGAVTVTGALTMPNDTVTFAKAVGVSPNVYGNIIKILPSDFMINDDAASPLSFKDGSNSGLHVNDTASEAIAFIAIPEGMKATHVDVYGTHAKTLKVWEVDVDSSFDFTGTTKGTGAMNTQLDITDVNATAENFLAIQVTLTATTQRIWGGKVTIAAQ